MDASKRVLGFIGLGRMGRGMAQNLLASGVNLVVFDVNKQAADGLLKAGARMATDIPSLARECEVVFTSLPGPAEIETVIFGRNGVAANLAPGSVLVDTSTSSHALALRLHEELTARGCHFLDAPVSGGPAGADAGELAIWVSGDEEVFERCSKFLLVMGSKSRFVGGPGSGTVIKLVHNLSACMIMAALGESFSLGVKAGVDPLELWQSLRLGVVGKQSPLDMIKERFLLGKYDPAGMALRLSYKDLKLATELGRDVGVPMRIADLTTAETLEAVGRGWGQQDAQAFLKLQLERAGVEIALDPTALAQET